MCHYALDPSSADGVRFKDAVVNGELGPERTLSLTPSDDNSRKGTKSDMDDVLGQVDNVMLERLRLGAQIEMPAGTRGIRRIISDLSVVSGNEIALIRLESGRRVLTMGGPNAVRIPKTARRVIAHTHPMGSLRLSAADIHALNRLEQRSTVVISPRDDIAVRVRVTRRRGNS
jgi:hypothetical protein